MAAALVLALGGAAAAAAVLVPALVRRPRRRGAAPLRAALGYELAELGQESFHPTQRFDVMAERTADGGGAERRALIDDARELYLSLQRAHDAGDLSTIEACTTPALYAALRADGIRVSAPTVVASLDVAVLESQPGAGARRAVVEFSALLHEAGAGGPHAVREVWILERDADASWRVGSVQEFV